MKEQSLRMYTKLKKKRKRMYTKRLMKNSKTGMLETTAMNLN